MGGPVLMTEQLHIQFPSLREVMNSYILSEVKQFRVKEDKRQHTHIYTYICICIFIFHLCSSFGHLFLFLRDLSEEPLHWL